MAKKNSDDRAFVQWYVQHSKKLSSASMAQWIVVIIAVVLLMIFHTISSDDAMIIQKIIQWSATISVASVGGYMLNSAVEKACREKFANMMQAVADDDENEDDVESGNG